MRHKRRLKDTPRGIKHPNSDIATSTRKALVALRRFAPFFRGPASLTRAQIYRRGRMVFWIVSGALALVVSVIIGLTLMRGRVGDKPPAAYDLQVYRDQLKEVDRDLARGVVGKEDAERTRAEISRRVLTADAQLKRDQDNAGKPNRSGAVIAVVLALVMIVGAFGLYTQIGTPGMGDLPLKSRMAASEAERA